MVPLMFSIEGALSILMIMIEQTTAAMISRCRVKSGTRTDIVPCVRQQQEHNNTNNTSTATSVVLV